MPVHLNRRALLWWLAATVRAAGQEPVYSVEVRLVRILATVKNANGELVGALDKDDFQVLDEGVEQEIAVFERRTGQPLSVALLVDTSLSTAIELRYEVESLRSFLKAFFAEGHAEDAIALYTFNYEVTRRAGFTRRVEAIEAVLKRLKPEGGTSLYDAIYLASQELEQRQGRRIVVVVTDGGDTTSAKDYHDALKAAHLADAVIYPILVMPIKNDPGRNIRGENALTGLALGTGGRVFAPSVGPALDEAFGEILRELRTQYLLGFYPRGVPQTRDGFHRLQVRVRRPDLQVSARSG
ncbi:MAG: VWA domain-containing protein, partial [Bryobacteraceae bacterium]